MSKKPFMQRTASDLFGGWAATGCLLSLVVIVMLQIGLAIGLTMIGISPVWLLAAMFAWLLISAVRVDIGEQRRKAATKEER